LHPLATDGFGNLIGGEDTQLVHTMSGASRETRKQLDFKLTHEWDEAALNFGAGTSVEPDYTSAGAASAGALTSTRSSLR
jgi:hypothetical protein